MIITGEGGINAALCTAAVLRRYTDPVTQATTLRRILWLGTAGVSPVVGGLAPTSTRGGGPGCAPLSPSTTARVALGSLCVTPAAIDLSCITCTSAAEPADACRLPACRASGLLNASGDGVSQCNEVLPSAAAALAARLQEFATSEWRPPTMPRELRAGVAVWWNASQLVAASPDHRGDVAPTTPTVLTQCAEVDTRWVWIGADFDYLCRRRAAEYLSYLQQRPDAVRASDVACISAMEGVGFLRAMRQHAAGRPPSALPPTAIVRGGSDYVYYPLTRSADGAWRQEAAYAPTPTMQVAGFRYAIATTNALALAFLAAASD